jgi:hypothetical protein
VTYVTVTAASLATLSWPISVPLATFVSLFVVGRWAF